MYTKSIFRAGFPFYGTCGSPRPCICIDPLGVKYVSLCASSGAYTHTYVPASISLFACHWWNSRLVIVHPSVPT